MAYFDDEPGSAAVEGLLDRAVISSVNWCEAYGKLRTRGVDSPDVTSTMGETGVAIRPFHASDARTAGDLVLVTRQAGLSLADRACLALAMRLGVPAVTADRAWRDLDVGVEIVCIR